MLMDVFLVSAGRNADVSLQRNVDSALISTGINVSNVTDRTLSDHMAKYLLQSRSDSTSRKYMGYFHKWQAFISAKGHSEMPAQPIHIALYFTQLLDNGQSFGVISSTRYAIKWFHEINGFHDPTDNGFVTNLVESAKRHATKKVIKKDPITVEVLKMLCDSYSDSQDLLVIRDLSMILLAFSGFLRFNELSSITCKDITFGDGYFSVHIAKSKTDQYRHGHTVVIAQGISSACPYAMLQKYFAVATIDNGSDSFLFKPAFRSGKTCKLIYKNKQLSYSRTRECFLNRLKPLVGDLNIGLHSLRAGGATAAANAQVDDRCWKRHGRWKSDSSKDGYVADSLERRLSVTKMLNM